MKSIKKYIVAFTAAATLAGFTSACQDDIDAPALDAPVASLTPNTTILDVKTEYWDDATNYIKQIEANEDGSHIVVSGRVISSDEASNVFKSLVIQDETAALAISIDSYNLYLNYRVGQEVVLDLTGMYIGKYNGLQQLGMPEWYEQGSAWEASFMSREFFQQHSQLNGLPEVEAIDTLVVNSFSELATDPDGLRKWQSQLVRFNNVTFEEGGQAQFSTYHSSGVNRVLKDKDGSSMNVRTSGYSNFWNMTLPSGAGDVVGILSFYGTSGWQLILIDAAGCMNFGNPTIAPGTQDNPYTVEEVVLNEQEGRSTSGWVTGYIVGAVAPETETVASNSDIEWGAPTELANTLVVGQTPDTKDIANALVIALPVDSKLRNLGNLREHPENLGRQIWLKGTFEKYMGTYGITGNTGSTAEFRIEGLDADAPTEGVSFIDETFDTALPADWTQVQVSGNKKWLWKEFSGNGYASMSGYGGTAPFDQWFITPAIDMSKVENKVLTFDNQGNSYGGTTSDLEVYVMTSADPSKATLTKLNYTKADLPSGAFSAWVSSGNIDLSSFTGVIHIGFRYTATADANYATLCIDNVKVGKNNGTGGETPDPDPVVPSGDYKGDFNSFNGGKAVSSPYGTYTNSTGWTAENAVVLAGQTSGTADAAPYFSFIGDRTTLAPTLNGNTTKVGKLTSPTLTGGIGTLTFSYGFAYNESKCSVTINILQGGTVVKSHEFTPASVAKGQAFSYSYDFNVSGDFVIEIVNNCLSNTSSGNKDRISIWNLTWTAN